MTPPKISVVIPIYIVEKYLRQCVDSVLGQTLKDIEIILVDDESPDNCPDICDEYANKDGRVRVIHQKNRGLGGARNAGIDAAKGAYVYFLDSDDWIAPDALAELLGAMESGNADVVLLGARLYIEDTQKYQRSWINNTGRERPVKFGPKNIFKTFRPAWGRLYKTEFLRRHKLYFVEKCLYEDNSWGCLVFILADTAAFAPNVYFHRRRAGQITEKIDARVFDWARDFKFFIEAAQSRNLEKNPKFKSAAVWYMKNFQHYFHKLPNNLRAEFWGPLALAAQGIDISKKDLREARLCRKDQRRVFRFYGQLSQMSSAREYQEYCDKRYEARYGQRFKRAVKSIIGLFGKSA